MPTQAQIDAARRNGAKSQGPKTPEGKAISSANSLRHGCCAKAIVLSNENPEVYCKLAAVYYNKFQPADDVECDIVDEMVIAKWRLRRDWSNEAALFDIEMDNQSKKVDSEYKKIDHASRYAVAFRALADESKAIQLFIRYEGAHHRSFYKALDTLLKLRAQTKTTADPVEPPAPQTTPASAETIVQPEPGTKVSPPEAPPNHQPQPPSKDFCETNPASTQPTQANHEVPGEQEAQNSSPGDQNGCKN